MSTSTVTINGVEYDKHTGLPIRARAAAAPAKAKAAAPAKHAHAVHQRVQKSTTLNRRYVQRTAAKPTAAPKQDTVSVQPVASNHVITRFAKQPIDATKHRAASPQRKVMADIAPVAHPVVRRVTAKKPTTVPKPSEIIKREAIEKSLSESTPAKHRRHREKPAKHSSKTRRARTLRLATAGTALFLIAGYFTYLNMPNLSVRVAAAQAGIDASYPSYRPSGYSLTGPVAFNDGQVSMKFAMNGTNKNFTLTQAKSSWDSAAVQNNYVIPATGTDYTITQANGLTIYTYGSDAVWVNGSILYTIKGDAALTADQIQRIATSL